MDRATAPHLRLPVAPPDIPWRPAEGRSGISRGTFAHGHNPARTALATEAAFPLEIAADKRKFTAARLLGRIYRRSSKEMAILRRSCPVITSVSGWCPQNMDPTKRQPLSI